MNGKICKNVRELVRGKVQNVTPIIKTSVPIFTVFVWIALYLPRIWQFGFLQGDWEIVHWANGGFTSGWAFWHALVTFSSRPVMIPIYGLLPGLIGFRPWLWQGLMTLLCLLISLKIYRIFQSLNLSNRYSFSSDIMAGMFLAFPWTVGFTGWPTLIMSLFALYFFLKACEVILAKEFSRGQVIKSSAYYLLSLLSYEAFFMQFLFLPLLRLFKKKAINWISFMETFWISGGFFVALLVAATFNRIIFFFVPIGTTKPLNYAWLLKDFKPAIINFWSNLTSGVLFYKDLFQYLAIGYGVLGVIGMILSSLKKKTPVISILLILVLFTCLILSIALYGMAGYSVTGTGTMARTTLVASLLLVFYIFVNFEVIREYFILRLGGQVLLVVLLAICIINLHYQQKIWSVAWGKLIETVHTFPIEQIKNVPYDSVLVFVGDTNLDGFQYLGNLELTAAIATIYPESRIPLQAIKNTQLKSYPHDTVSYWAIAEHSVARLFYVKGQGQIMSFDGSQLQQELPGNWQFTYPANNVFIWDPALAVDKLEQCIVPCVIR